MEIHDKITAIHSGVEKSRNAEIPDWAYRDVLFMLIHYSIASFELLERKLNDHEKNDLYDVFLRMGSRMNLKGLPANYKDWTISHEEHLQADLLKSDLTVDLFKQYRKHLGAFRYKLLPESQKLVVPYKVKVFLNFNNINWLSGVLWFYKLSRKLKFDGFLKSIILPSKYKVQIKALDKN